MKFTSITNIILGLASVFAVGKDPKNKKDAGSLKKEELKKNEKPEKPTK